MRPTLPLALAALILAAGCVTPAAEEIAPSDTPALPPTAEPMPVAHEGSFGVGFFGCAAIMCQGRSVVPSERLFEMDAEGVLDLALTMSWDATSPRTEEMVFGVFTCDPEQCQSDSDLTKIESVQGASPLALDLTAFEVPDGEVLYIWANVYALVSGPAFASVSTPQSFTIEGTITPLLVGEPDTTTA